MLFTIINGPNIEKALELLDQAIGRVDGIEIRLDSFLNIKPIQFEPLLKKANEAHLKVLFALRPKRQGGGFESGEKERLDLIELFCDLDPDYVDLEHDVSSDFRQILSLKHPKIQFFSSYHNFEETPKDLKSVLDSIHSEYAHIYKIATFARSSLDALRMIKFVNEQKAHHTLIGISMGEEGSITRILAPVFGNYLSFAMINPEEQTAPGQFEIKELLDIYHYSSLNMHTRFFGVIGSPLNKSVGKHIHNAVFSQMKINGCYVTMPIKVEELSSFFSLIKDLPFSGLSVTMPLKELVVSYLDEVTPSAQVIGAVNTIAIKDGKMIGYNTDGIGALEAIEKYVPIKGQRIVVVGAGGSAKAIICEAIARGARVSILNRTESKALQLAKTFGCQGGGMDLLPKVFREGYDILINCTPTGESIDPRWLIPGSYVMDIVYNPKETPFLLKAIEKKCHPIFGIDMYINQAVEQQVIWQGSDKRAQIRKIIASNLLKRGLS